ncbi:MAG: hypothetical protein H0V67_02575 [Geodermatophilaceae bacterium]|nr:hypothetical protein [Geodermatophilaceae bacterium]
MTTAYLRMPSGLTAESRHVTVAEGVGKHDMATVMVPNAQQWRGYQDRPVVVSIVDGAHTKRIAGYIDTVAPVASGKDRRGAVFVLGGSSAMRSGTPRAWTDATPVNIARDLLQPYGFGLEMEAYEYRLPFFAQQGSASDWATLNALAAECGMVVHAYNTTVRMVHPATELRRSVRTPQHTYTLDAGGINTFVGVNSLSPMGFEHRRFFGVDKFGSAFDLDVNPGQPVSVGSGETLTSLAAAQEAVQRAQKRRFLQRRATLDAIGAADVRAGDCLTIVEGSTRSLWFVMEAHHEFKAKQNTFRSEFALCRDDNDSAPTPAPHRGVGDRPASVLVNGRWRSQRGWSVTL